MTLPIGVIIPIRQLFSSTLSVRLSVYKQGIQCTFMALLFLNFCKFDSSELSLLFKNLMIFRNFSQFVTYSFTMGHLEVKKLDETFCSENHDTNIASDTKRNEVNFDDTRKILELFNMCVCNYIYSYFLHRNLHNFNFPYYTILLFQSVTFDIESSSVGKIQNVQEEASPLLRSSPRLMKSLPRQKHVSISFDDNVWHF